MAHSIYHADIDAVSDGMRALNGAPRVVLRSTELGLLRRVPADCRRIEEHGGPLQGGKARPFRIPLVPADQRPYSSELRIVSPEAQVARGEIELFVVQGIVRDMHFAVDTAQLAARIEDGGGVVIHARRALFK